MNVVERASCPFERRDACATIKGIISEHLAWIRLQMRGDLAQEHGAELAQLPVAHPADARKFPVGGRIKPRHLPQRHVRKNNVGRHAALVGQLFAQLAQLLEQHLVAGNFADAMLGRLGGRNGPGERDFLPGFERRAARSVSSAMLNFSAFWKRKPSRTSSRPMAPHSARVCSPPIL